MPGARFGRRVCIGLAAAAFVLLAPASSVGESNTERGLYVALGDSLTYGVGASSTYKSWVQLYYGHLQSNGSGVADVASLGQPGYTSTDLRNQLLGRAVADINTSS